MIKKFSLLAILFTPLLVCASPDNVANALRDATSSSSQYHESTVSGAITRLTEALVGAAPNNHGIRVPNPPKPTSISERLAALEAQATKATASLATIATALTQGQAAQQTTNEQLAQIVGALATQQAAQAQTLAQVAATLQAAQELHKSKKPLTHEEAEESPEFKMLWATTDSQMCDVHCLKFKGTPFAKEAVLELFIAANNGSPVALQILGQLT